MTGKVTGWASRYLPALIPDVLANPATIGRDTISDMGIGGEPLQSRFGDLSTFNAHFRSAMGAAPGVWRRARGQILVFAHVDCRPAPPPVVAVEHDRDHRQRQMQSASQASSQSVGARQGPRDFFAIVSAAAPQAGYTVAIAQAAYHHRGARVRPNPSLNPRPTTAGAVRPVGGRRSITARPYSTCLRGRG